VKFSAFDQSNNNKRKWTVGVLSKK
jgi:hypothetical protein